jgi:hypothetical protein
MVRRAERNLVTWHRASRQPAQLDRLVAAVAVSLELHSVPVQSIPARWNLHTSAVVHVARKFGARQWRCFILPGRTEPQRLEPQEMMPGAPLGIILQDDEEDDQDRAGKHAYGGKVLPKCL